MCVALPVGVTVHTAHDVLHTQGKAVHDGEHSGGTKKMTADKPVRRIASVGTGVIGASWAAQYLARGFDVIATDPAPNAETNLRKYVDDAWPALTAIGLTAGASRERLSFTTDMKK